MVEHYGERAEVQAAELASAMCARGDFDGQRVWLEIVKAIVRLRQEEPVS